MRLRLDRLGHEHHRHEDQLPEKGVFTNFVERLLHGFNPDVIWLNRNGTGPFRQARTSIRIDVAKPGAIPLRAKQRENIGMVIGRSIEAKREMGLETTRSMSDLENRPFRGAL